MKIEIRDEIKGTEVEDKIDQWEGVISAKTGKLVFWVTGDRYKTIINFDDEEELDEFIKTLNYFKEHKYFPPKE